YTSCGWFFDELSGIETIQIIQYAGRAIQLAETILRKGIEDEFLALLEGARGNVSEHATGRMIYEKWVRPAVIDMRKVGAHYAISSLFEDYGDSTQIFSHLVEREDGSVLHAGKTRLTLGRARVTSRITGASSTFSYGVLHLGGQNIYGGIRDYQGHRAYSQLTSQFSDILHRGDIPELIRSVDKQFGGHFGGATFSLRLLFRDEQRRIVERLLLSADQEAAAKLRELHREHATLVRFVGDLGIPLPRRVMASIEFTLNDDLLIELSAHEPNPQRIREILTEIEHMKVSFDAVTAEFRFRRNLEAATQTLAESPGSLAPLQRLNRLTGICAHLPFPINLWQVQTSFWTIADVNYPAQLKKARQGSITQQKWVQLVQSLAEKLKIRLP
ncbi:MAG TPA: glycoside hydrolase, partial [Nitrospira sp.]|nr:glycoside hydrolase [Nitrospira sp.]